mmetsp:Transcript_5579/g.17954  ORF Transcript_5579/g.17954 Transcript_5579/m.17954 type:complete len:269 (+) Transcript_5579:129-935(+)
MPLVVVATIAHLTLVLPRHWAPSAGAAAGLPASRRAGAAPVCVFSGIVEEIGEVRRLEQRDDLPLWDGGVGEGVELEVGASTVLEGAYLGCSIAVNGVCLTVTKFDADSFCVGLAPETLRRTNLQAAAPGAALNLERALAADGRNSGHLVQGHVDDVGTIEAMVPDGEALTVRVRPPKSLLPYIVPKGFICVDGTSLTVCEVNQAEGWFDFMLVSFTQAHITLPRKAVGDAVNLEVDVTAKYVERSVGGLAQRVAELEAEVARLKAAQ